MTLKATQQQLEELLFDPNFQELNKRARVFCPFEAIGMVNQEIRHAHFLSYCLDPNRPHGFGSTLLTAFIDTVIDASDDTHLNRLDLYLHQSAQFEVRREWNDIDLLIKIPELGGNEGHVIAVELKINAKESKHQLSKYREIIGTTDEFKGYDPTYVFLTKNADQAEYDEGWVPLGLDPVLVAMKSALDQAGVTSPASQTFTYYEQMMRNNHLENNELEALAHKIWAKHGEALNDLIMHKPDHIDGIARILVKRMASIADKIGNNFVANNYDYTKCVWFYRSDWDLETKNEDSLIYFNISEWSEGFRAAVVIEPDEDKEARDALTQLITDQTKNGLETGRTKSKKSEGTRFVVAKWILKKEQLDGKLEKGTSHADIAKEIEEAFTEFVRETTPYIDKAIAKYHKKYAEK